MRLTGVVTRKGQITIPAEIRRALDLDVGDRVVFDLVDDEIHVRPAGSVVTETAGALRGDEASVSAEELRNLAETAIADATCERSKAK